MRIEVWEMGNMGKLLVKLITFFLVIYVVAALLPAVRITFSYALVTTLLIAGLDWIADRLLLPHLRNVVASATDGLSAFLILWIADLFAPNSAVTFTYLLLVGVIIAGFEFMFHRSLFKIENYDRKGA
ncbi:hypothetical protein skT53_34150 [Effusibacillus dendaii]|uniref:DUF2512 family protein n=2 Tax=Effusibacillus dendaii TaxID=2743772 RepID=A0A7I8DIE4_9BACL|nr:hypothetical protein skT53_34150 [Effusibacillus dendaii]